MTDFMKCTKSILLSSILNSILLPTSFCRSFMNFFTIKQFQPHGSKNYYKKICSTSESQFTVGGCLSGRVVPPTHEVSHHIQPVLTPNSLSVVYLETGHTTHTSIDSSEEGRDREKRKEGRVMTHDGTRVKQNVTSKDVILIVTQIADNCEHSAHTHTNQPYPLTLHYF